MGRTHLAHMASTRIFSSWFLLCLGAVLSAEVPKEANDQHDGLHHRFERRMEQYLSDVEAIHPTWEDYVNGVDALLQNPAYRSELKKHEKEYQDMMTEEAKKKEQFPCVYSDDEGTQPRKTRPATVDELTAGDIEIVGALGDSITAGNGINAYTLVGVRTQYRGYSWSVGGEVDYQDGSTTVPNALKYFSPDLTGFSMHNGKADEYTAARFNQAVPGSIARDLPDQAHALVKLFQDHALDDDEWKLITLFIGGNDLCRFCNNPTVLSAQNYAGYIKEALEILEKDLKNVFVNVVGMFDVTPLGDIKKGFACRKLEPLLCPCGTDPADMPAVAQAVKDYNAETEKMIKEATHLTTDRKDFTVVYQPMMRDNDIPRNPDGGADLSFFAPDCFHFSRKGHNSVAKFLWNVLFVPVGKKPTSTPYDVKLYCPAKDELIKTARNSQPGWTPLQEDRSTSWWDWLMNNSSQLQFYLTASCVVLLMIALVLVLFILVLRRPSTRVLSIQAGPLLDDYSVCADDYDNEKIVS